MAYANLDGFGWLVEDMQAWTAAQIASAAAHYEPKIVFDDTPVYSVTLAEDVVVSSSYSHEIDLGDKFQGLSIYLVLPAAAAAANGSIELEINDSWSVLLRIPINATSVSYVCVRAINENGVLMYSRNQVGNSFDPSQTYGYSQTGKLVFGGPISALRFSPGAGSGYTIFSGTEIVIYGAKEV